MFNFIDETSEDRLSIYNLVIYRIKTKRGKSLYLHRSDDSTTFLYKPVVKEVRRQVKNNKIIEIVLDKRDLVIARNLIVNYGIKYLINYGKKPEDITEIVNTNISCKYKIQLPLTSGFLVNKETPGKNTNYDVVLNPEEIAYVLGFNNRALDSNYVTYSMSKYTAFSRAKVMSFIYFVKDQRNRFLQGKPLHDRYYIYI